MANCQVIHEDKTECVLFAHRFFSPGKIVGEGLFVCDECVALCEFNLEDLHDYYYQILMRREDGTISNYARTKREDAFKFRLYHEPIWLEFRFGSM